MGQPRIEFFGFGFGQALGHDALFPWRLKRLG